MRKACQFLAFIFVAVLILAGCKDFPYDTFEGEGSVTNKERPLAMVDNDTINLHDYNRALNNHGWHREDNLDTMNFKMNVLKDMVVYRAARLNAPDYQLEMTPDIEERMEDHLHAQLRQLLFENEVKPRIEVTEEQVEEHYQRNISRFTVPESADVSQILFSNYRPFLEQKFGIPQNMSTEAIDSMAYQRAMDVWQQIQNGAEFEEMAEVYSDDSISGNRGGEMGVIRRGEAAPNFDSVAFSIPLNIASEPISTRFGYHIIKVSERIEAEVAPLDSTIRKMLHEELTNAETRRQGALYFDSLYAVSEITFNEEFIESGDSLDPDNEWVIVINGEDSVYQRSYWKWQRNELAKDPRIKPDQHFRRELLRHIANNYLLIFAAYDLGFHETPEYAEARDKFIFQEKLNKLMSQRFDKDYEPTDEEIRAYYEANKHEFAEDTAISIQHLVVEDKETALEVKQKLDNGANFYETAMQYYPAEEDEIKELAINLGWIKPGEFSEDFFKKIYAVEIDSVSEPIKTEYGYHLVKVLGKTGVERLETVRLQVRKRLIQEHKDSTLAAWQARMLEGHRVKVDKQLLEDFIFQVDWLPKPDFSGLRQSG